MISHAAWAPPREGNRYVGLRVDVGELLERLPPELSITPVLAAATARALHAVPALNARVLFGGSRPRRDHAISVVVLLDDNNLAVAHLDDAHRASAHALSMRIEASADRLRRHEDDEFERSMQAVRGTPMWLLRPGLSLTGWLSGALGITNRALGLEENPLGSVCISNIGGFALDEAFSPPTPFAHCPVDLLAGEIVVEPAVVDGRIGSRKVLPLSMTFDARIAGWDAVGAFCTELRRWLGEVSCLEQLLIAPNSRLV